MCSKVWEEITIPRFADHPRYGDKAGQSNPRFLDAKVFVEEVLPPYEQAFHGHIGPFIFEFQRTGLIPSTFLPRLDTFLSQLPTRYRYAIEVRNPLILTPKYKDMLAAQEPRTCTITGQPCHHLPISIANWVTRLRLHLWSSVCSHRWGYRMKQP
jgi:hypothetical protein